MPIARPILSLAALLLLAGGIVMEFLIVLSGSHVGSPTNQVYFLQAATGGIKNGNSQYQNPARWTYLSICGVGNGLNQNCGPTHAAQSFDPPLNFGTTTGVPASFIGTTKFYYLSRFAWAFYIVALFFAVMAFFLGFLALCTRLGAYLTGLMSILALFFQTLTAALMTAWTVIARNAFQANGQTAFLGLKAYGFTWGAMGCFLLATILFCVGGSVGKKDNYQQKSSYFGRKKSTRSTRSRGSFIDSESQRRVKDEYE
ncbi:Eisosomes component [Friedmanniomyces endolithicus]|uniref:Eisosomes component n=1 Tax=Friedmanniomyces endolithicus TaxID=329885 RepID=A0A4U0V7M4_9PEZI|nr:Eisosomes component [Friedmanniomyces endolithicus]KAK0336184.1 Eisosomes component [Friedmanniomyces endolithicus]KAK0783187.1 Eisosomes component [Friedmanniomyces endolithicus]KAK0791481.1 Eisosomes component [Friedmanniomyces endolithicus]KAK0810498.1 Eisosomes component [Friedmanniomyces endolithicus]